MGLKPTLPFFLDTLSIAYRRKVCLWSEAGPVLYISVAALEHIFLVILALFWLGWILYFIDTYLSFQTFLLKNTYSKTELLKD